MGKQENWSLLVNSHDSIETGIITSILAEEGIPILKKSPGSGAYMEVFMGISNTGFDIYVPASQLADANQLLKAAQQEFLNQVPKPIEIPESIERKRIWGQRIIVIMYLVPLLLGSFYFIINTFIQIFNQNKHL